MKHRDDPVTLSELAEYYIRNRLKGGEWPTIASVAEHAQTEGVRADCLLVLVFGFEPGKVYPTQVRRGDWEMIACIDAAARAAGISRTVEVY